MSAADQSSKSHMSHLVKANYLARPNADRLVRLHKPGTASVVFVGPGGKTVLYHSPCLSDLFTWNTQQQSASSNKQGMICPGLTVNRPSSVTNLSVAYYNNLVSSDPQLYCYQGCSCAVPLVAFYYTDAHGQPVTCLLSQCEANPALLCIVHMSPLLL